MIPGAKSLLMHDDKSSKYTLHTVAEIHFTIWHKALLNHKCESIKSLLFFFFLPFCYLSLYSRVNLSPYSLFLNSGRYQAVSE